VGIYFSLLLLFKYLFVEFQVLQTVKDEFTSLDKDYVENLNVELNSEKYVKDEIKNFSKKIKAANKSIETDSGDFFYAFGRVFFCILFLYFFRIVVLVVDLVF
jgi:hypothetical protein